MDSRGRVQIREACVVPYRLTPSGVQFCLVSPVADNRWEFPKTSLDNEGVSLPALLAQAATAVGLRGQLRDDPPLGHFDAARGSESRSMTGYLMRVVESADTWPRQAAYRRLWCLAEEARVRIRRKPLRRFLDLALHCHEVCEHPIGNGKASNPTSTER